jgi:protein involved in polysaccharide export with SLBB domain
MSCRRSFGVFRSSLLSVFLSVSLFDAAPVFAAAAAQTGTPNPTMTSQDTYAGGDRLKIAVFERVGAQGSTEQNSTGYIERSEIAGDYTVRQDGSLLLPFLQPVNAANRNELELEQTLEQEYARALGVSVKVNVRTIEREPVYVVGGTRPAAVKYLPGMLVVQALALAGNLEGSGGDWVRVDLARERERVAKSRERTKTLLAQLEVLTAERDGRVPGLPPDLVTLVGRDSAQARVNDELRIRALEKKRRDEEINSLQLRVDSVNQELTSLHNRLGAAEAVIKDRTDFVNTLQTARSHMAVTELTYHQAQGEVEAAREQLNQVRDAISEAERKVLELEQAKTRAGLDAELQRERDIQGALNALREDRILQSNVESVVNGLDTHDSNGLQKISITIVKRGPNGVVHKEADLYSELRPGDILQVSGSQFVNG